MNLRFEQWEKPINGIKGTIRTIPENYYVCDVSTDNQLDFTEIEANTRGIDKKAVRKWFDENVKLKGILVFILRSAQFSDSTRNGISSKISKAILTGEGVAELFTPSDDAPELKLIKRNIYGKTYYHCEPATHTYGWMAGGNFIYSCDSRYHDIIDYPIEIHDRRE